MIRRLVAAVPAAVWGVVALVLFAAAAVQVGVDQHRAGVVIDELAADSRRQRAALASAGVDPDEVGPAPEERLRALDGDPVVLDDPPALSPAERDELADEAARRALARVTPPPAVSSSPPVESGERPDGGTSGDRGPDDNGTGPGPASTVSPSPSPSPSPVTRCPSGTVRDRVEFGDGRTGSGCVDVDQPSPSPSSTTPEPSATSEQESQEFTAAARGGGPGGMVGTALVAAAGIAAATSRRRL